MIILLATLIHKGAVAFNPKMISDETFEDEESIDVDGLHKDGKNSEEIEPEFKKNDIGAML